MNPRTPFVCAVARRIRKLEPESHPLVTNNATLFTIMTCVMVASFLPDSVSPNERMSIFAVFWLSAWFWCADELQELLHESEWMRCLAYLPVSRLRSFQILYRRFLNQTFAWAAGIAAMTYFVPGVGGWSFLGICLLQFLLLLAASSLLSTWDASIPHVLIGLGTGTLGFLLIPIYMAFPGAESVADNILTFLPTGWCQLALIDEGGVGPEYASLLLLLLASLAVMRLVPIYRGYQPSSQSVLLNTGDPFMEMVEDATALYSEYDLRPKEEIRKEALRDGQEALRENIRTRWWLEPYEWWNEGGFLARFIAQRLDQRQKRVVEFLLLSQPTWTRRWRIAVALSVAATLAVVFLPSDARWLALGPMLAGAYSGLAPPSWPGLGKVLKGIPYFRLHPVAPGELAKLSFKIEAVRFLAFLPFLTTFALLSGGGLRLLGHTVFLLLALQWYAAGLKLGTRDRVHQLLVALTFLVLVGGLVSQHPAVSGCGLVLSYLSLMRWAKDIS